MSKVIQYSLNIQGCLVKKMVLSGIEQAVANLKLSVMWYVCYRIHHYVSHHTIVLIIIVDINVDMECPF